MLQPALTNDPIALLMEKVESEILSTHLNALYFSETVTGHKIIVKN